MKRKAILFITIFFVGCALDIPDPDKLPVWSTTLEVPIIETTIDLDEFLKQLGVTHDAPYFMSIGNSSATYSLSFPIHNLHVDLGKVCHAVLPSPISLRGSCSGMLHIS